MVLYYCWNNEEKSWLGWEWNILHFSLNQWIQIPILKLLLLRNFSQFRDRLSRLSQYMYSGLNKKENANNNAKQDIPISDEMLFHNKNCHRKMLRVPFNRYPAYFGNFSKFEFSSSKIYFWLHIWIRSSRKNTTNIFLLM